MSKTKRRRSVIVTGPASRPMPSPRGRFVPGVEAVPPTRHAVVPKSARFRGKSVRVTNPSASARELAR